MLLMLLAVLAAPQDASPALRVGTYSYPQYDREAALAPLARAVEQVAGRPAHVVLLDTPDALADAMCRGEVDVAMTNLGAFVKMRECPRLQAVAVLDTPPGVLDRYRGVLLTRRDTAIADLTELASRARDLRYSEVLPGSTSGALVQAEALGSVGIAPMDFSGLRHARTHEGALADLQEGRADIAALAEEPWRKFAADHPDRAAALTPLWRSEPLPPGPVTCREAAVDCAALGAALLGQAGDAVAAPLSEGWSETLGAKGFIPFDASRYAPFKPR
ncbi:phosphate/phosphite/phosphonate ABC transporter substrate-binding protein [Brevundimonas faecalis]|uniref:Phosphonate transport system substrate-binding protein n=1 Tax=Brevundimonas faecalis TaxID=947378 RepID=A0ABV2RH19_9CAUL